MSLKEGGSVKELGREREWFGGDQNMMSESLSLCLSVCVCVPLVPPSIPLSPNLLLSPIQSIEDRGGAGVRRERGRRGGEERGREDVERGREEEEILPSAEQASADKKK